MVVGLALALEMESSSSSFLMVEVRVGAVSSAIDDAVAGVLVVAAVGEVRVGLFPDCSSSSSDPVRSIGSVTESPARRFEGGESSLDAGAGRFLLRPSERLALCDFASSLMDMRLMFGEKLLLELGGERRAEISPSSARSRQNLGSWILSPGCLGGRVWRVECVIFLIGSR